jgi:hypothetical protein
MSLDSSPAARNDRCNYELAVAYVILRTEGTKNLLRLGNICITFIY